MGGSPFSPTGIPAALAWAIHSSSLPEALASSKDLRNSLSNFTIAIGLSAFKGRYGVNWNHLMAASVMVAIPGVLIYAFLQRYFTEGILLGGVKG